MSILCCDDCGRLIDTDDDPESYFETLDKWLCVGCREELDEEVFDKEEAFQDTKYKEKQAAIKARNEELANGRN